MRKAARVVLFVAAATALVNSAAGVFGYIKIALGAEEARGPLTESERLDMLLWLATVPFLLGILWCLVRLQKCRFKTSLWLTAGWIGLLTWLYWFGSSPATQMYEVHSLDPAEIRAERLLHLAWVTAKYAIVVAVFSLFPFLKLVQLRWERSTSQPGPTGSPTSTCV